jgi:hypothetical protein
VERKSGPRPLETNSAVPCTSDEDVAERTCGVGGSNRGFFFLAVDVGPRVEYVPDPLPTVPKDTVPLPPDAYGIPMAGYVLEHGVVKSGDTFGGLLTSRGVDQEQHPGLVELALPHFDVKRMRAGIRMPSSSKRTTP